MYRLFYRSRKSNTLHIGGHPRVQDGVARLESVSTTALEIAVSGVCSINMSRTGRSPKNPAFDLGVFTDGI
jgi:hypothetical protein